MIELPTKRWPLNNVLCRVKVRPIIMTALSVIVEVLELNFFCPVNGQVKTTCPSKEIMRKLMEDTTSGPNEM
jgi:hypothetical protein